MSVTRVLVVLGCDYCDSEINLDFPSLQQGLSNTDAERTARDYSWWQRADGTDVCPSHPRSAS